ncbi:MAG: cation:proton antiporter [Deltaproteobacteria bacterium]|nr:cation:proton antiporter [Deltaproteobacteria bacterium]
MDGHHASEALMVLFIVFVAAQIGAEIVQRMKLPAVVGEIAAGCAIGPFGLGLISLSEPLEVLAEIGAVLLLFSVGLETSLNDLRRIGKTAMLVGIAGVILPFISGGLWAYGSGFNLAKSMFIGAAFVATSVGITARVLQELKVMDRTESKMILGSAVIDDILAMLLLGLVTSFQATGSVEPLKLSLVIVQALVFIVLIAVMGVRLIKRSSNLLELPINPHSPLTLSIAGCLGLAAASGYVGLAAIIGAFLAGMVMSESQQKHTLEKQMEPISAFLVPFFFVVTGAKVDLAQLASWDMIVTVLIVSVLAIASKLIGCGLAARSLGKRSALIVGMGMVPRGEVGIIVASLGLQAGVFTNSVYGVIIAMSLITSLVGPLALKRLISGHATAEGPAPG